ncbi:hypothetical protein B0T17DRAFT_512494 [Bombardia bombarda]|uniref:Uncharacterized protein n=1 Tax=Bombardia bombarda TaxID=252184 RepID=A0AA39U3G5_9PEZI|nr:hypothetical protein B0T17DRAFT_512494 [Bombardia bombarda]
MPSSSSSYQSSSHNSGSGSSSGRSSSHTSSNSRDAVNVFEYMHENEDDSRDSYASASKASSNYSSSKASSSNYPSPKHSSSKHSSVKDSSSKDKPSGAIMWFGGAKGNADYSIDKKAIYKKKHNSGNK